MTFLPIAQAQNSRLTGRISDPSGGGIPAADITVTETQTAQTRFLRSDGTGTFNAAALQPGSYTVQVMASGFETLKRRGVTLDLDNTTRLDLTLAVGKGSESVTVTADATQLQPTNPEMSLEITEKQFQDLPLVQQNRLRNPASFVYLAPGVQGSIRLDGAEYTGATNVITVNGGPIWNTEILIEGLPGGQTRIVGNYTESSPPVDAVSEFKVTTTLLPADFGHTGFGVGSFGIKSGTNNVHSSVFEYFRNTALDAANWYAKNQGAFLTNPPIHQNEFGATIGGPVKIPHVYDGKDRTFFFFAYAGSRFSGATSYGTSTVATIQERTVNGAGFYDFSDVKTPIYDPATTATNPKGAGFVRTAFAGNLIPASRIDPVSAKIIAYLPKTAVGATTIGGFQGDTLLQPNTYTAKVDHVLSPSQHLSLTWVHTSIPRTNLGSALPSPLASGYHQTVSSQTARINHTWTLRPTLVNLAAIGYNRFDNPQTPTGTDGNYPLQLGLKGLGGGLFPQITLTGYTSLAGLTVANKTENDFYYKDQMYWTLRRHSLRFGGEYRAIRYDDLSPSTTTGTFGFKTNETGNPQSQSGTGNAFASFLLGQVDASTVVTPFPLRTRKYYTGFFLQDDWKVSSRLTLNLGFRMEWQGAPKEANDHQSIVNLTTPNPGAGSLPGALTFASAAANTFFGTDYSALSPRIGFAFQVDPKVVVRGGYGVYYSDYLPNTDIVNSGFASQGNFANTTGSISPVFTLASGVPAFSPTQTLTATALNGAADSYYGPNVGAMPRTQNYSLDVQYQLAPNTLLEASYVGDHNTRQVAPNLLNINQVNPKYLSLSSALLTSTATVTTLAAAGITTPYTGFSGTVAQALRPYPQYSTLTSVAAKAGSSNYNAGQLLIRQRLSHGLSVNAHYIYSKLLGYSSATLEGNTGTDNSVQNAYNLAADYTVLPNDVRHTLVISSAYQLPFGAGRRFLNQGKAVNAFVGGFTVSGIERYQSGFPFSFLVSSNALPLFNRYQRPNIVQGVDPSTHTPVKSFNPVTGSNLFNAAAFALPGNSSFGNASPTFGNLRNYAVLSEDLQLTKRTKLTEGLLWSFYAQAFNPFNRHRLTGFGTALGATNFGLPNASSAARALQFGTRFEF